MELLELPALVQKYKVWIVLILRPMDWGFFKYFFPLFLIIIFLKSAACWRSEFKFQLSHHLRHTRPLAKIMSLIWTLSYSFFSKVTFLQSTLKWSEDTFFNRIKKNKQKKTLVSLVWPISHLNDFILPKMFPPPYQLNIDLLDSKSGL